MKLSKIVAVVITTFLVCPQDAFSKGHPFDKNDKRVTLRKAPKRAPELAKHKKVASKAKTIPVQKRKDDQAAKLRAAQVAKAKAAQAAKVKAAQLAKAKAARAAKAKAAQLAKAKAAQIAKAKAAKAARIKAAQAAKARAELARKNALKKASKPASPNYGPNWNGHFRLANGTQVNRRPNGIEMILPSGGRFVAGQSLNINGFELRRDMTYSEFVSALNRNSRIISKTVSR